MTGVTIEWIGHACFRIVSGGTTIVTDPYDPAELTLPPVALSADYVIASSLTDPAHSAVDLVEGSPKVIDALDESDGQLPFELVTAKKRESPLHPDGVRDNAMYALRLDGLWIVHMGDTGEALTDDDYEIFAGKCDVLLALAGGELTIPLQDLDVAVTRLTPKWVIPMHYALPGMHVTLLPVASFLERRGSDPILLARTSSMTFDAGSPPAGAPTVVVLSAAALSTDGVRFGCDG